MMRPMVISLLLSVLICGLSTAGQFVPFVIPARPNPDSLIACEAADPIDVRHERLVARDGHFYCKGQRVRLWGVNLSFAANFPTHEDAVQVAARLAEAGVNTIRCHHMDTSLWPRGIYDDKDPTRLSAEALDRLDYFIDQLAKRRIWVNINLHVGREHSKYIGLPKVNRKYDKISCIFTPKIIDAHENHARDLLTHVNKYRKVRYCDDPAVAVVEITNENSFFMWSSEDTLRSLPDYYADILQKLYNDWLVNKYGSDGKLRSQWAREAEPLGRNLLRNGSFTLAGSGGRGAADWNVEQHNGCKASASIESYKSKKALRFDIQKKDDTDWHLQLTNAGFALEEGKYYTVTFAAATAESREIRCSVSQAHDPWGNMGLSRTVGLTSDWREFTMGFVAGRSDKDCRISFTLGGGDESVYLANVQLRPGGRVGLADGESIAGRSVKLYGDNESPDRAIDRMIFLAEIEKKYFDRMRNFIKKDLGCEALVTGTIVFGPLGLYGQSDMDFIDAHAYWQHPRFPGRPWDRSNWLIDQKPMVDYHGEATLPRLAAERLQGKPFTVSEYNHPAPLDSQAECVPLIAAYGAVQDWDGVWLYTYSHSGDQWYRDHMSSYFDIDTNPAKWGFMRAGTAIFRDAGLRPFKGRLVVRLARAGNVLADLAQLQAENSRSLWAVVSEKLSDLNLTRLDRPLYLSFDSEANVSPPSPPTPVVVWETGKGQGAFMAGGGAGVLAGHGEKIAAISNDAGRIDGTEFVTVTATALDGRPWFRSGKILLTACGRCENTGMKFSEDRRTVGLEWGHGPVQIEAVEGSFIVPNPSWKCHALKPDGTIGAEVPVQSEGGRTFIEIGPKYKTMWYLMTAE